MHIHFMPVYIWHMYVYIYIMYHDVFDTLPQQESEVIPLQSFSKHFTVSLGCPAIGVRCRIPGY